ncbi:MAG TPA: hypothetical protein VNO70_18675 [Blastocatellia bacterium]|nr:hypothetical protein [Blastocatellia bacterium]
MIDLKRLTADDAHALELELARLRSDVARLESRERQLRESARPDAQELRAVTRELNEVAARLAALDGDPRGLAIRRAATEQRLDAYARLLKELDAQPGRQDDAEQVRRWQARDRERLAELARRIGGTARRN